MRKRARILANQLFVKYPRLGQWGYDFLRVTNLTRATRETKQLMFRFKSLGFKIPIPKKSYCFIVADELFYIKLALSLIYL